MAKVGVFSIYDAVVRAFAPPFFAPNRGAAIRMFSDAANDEKSQLKRHAADHSLFILGEFDDNSGSLLSLSAPERLISATEVIQDEVPPGFARS